MCVGYTRPGCGYATVCETCESIMTNLQPIDLHDVAQYWKSRGLVAERHLPYYVRWLQRFLAGPGGDPSLAPGDAQRVFVGQLEREQVPEWQVGQAARAVELYQKHFRWIRWARPTANLSKAERQVCMAPMSVRATGAACGIRKKAQQGLTDGLGTAFPAM